MMTGFTTHGLEATARALSKKHDITVITGTGRLCTDGKKIYLPTIPPHIGDYRMTSVIRGWIDHEVGHIVGKSDTHVKEVLAGRYGEPGGDVINALEDIRVNQLMRRWAGCAWNIDGLYRWAKTKAISPETGLDRQVLMELTRRAELPRHAPWVCKDKQAVAEICDEYEAAFGPAGDCVNAGSTRELVSQARWLCRKLGLEVDKPHSDKQKQDKADAAEAMEKAQGGSSQAGEDSRKAQQEYERANAGFHAKDKSAVRASKAKAKADDGGDQDAIDKAKAAQVKQEQLRHAAKDKCAEKFEAAKDAANKAGKACDAVDEAGKHVDEVAERASRAGIAACKEQSVEMAEKIMQYLKAEAEHNPVAKRGPNSGAFTDTRPGLDRCKRFDDGCPAFHRGHLPPDSATPADFVKLVRSTAPRLTHKLRQWLLSEPKHGWQTDQRRGMLDTRRIAELATGTNDRVLKKRIEVKAPDTACYLMLDGSFSMNEHALAADGNYKWYSHFSAVAAGVFADVISSARHALEIGVFTGSTHSTDGMSLTGDAATDDAMWHNNDIRCSGADILQLKAWQEPMRLAWPNLTAAQAVSYQGTPLDGAIKYATEALLARPESRKILIAFTDGDPDVVPRARWQCKQTTNAGIDLLLVGIKETGVRELHDRTIVVTEPAKLSERLLLGFESIIKTDRRTLRKAV